jgi:tetratricopeptide (TPR) repeat protein
VVYLADAGRGLPKRARIQYNLGLLLQQLGRSSDAEAAFNQALSLEPVNHDYLLALADFYLKQRRLPEARVIAQQMTALSPGDPTGPKIIDLIERLEAVPQD